MAKRALSVSDTSAFAPVSAPRRRDRPQKRAAFTSLRKNPVFCLSLQLSQTYKVCNPEFRGVGQLPQRTLTNPDEPAGNDGMDNSDGNLICRVHDELRSPSSVFTILDLLGTGTFGQVFRCQKNGTKEVVAVKVVKNKPAYRAQGAIEVKVVHMLNETYGSDRIVKLLDHFEYKNHLCIVLELLSISVLDILQQNQFRGFPLAVVRDFTIQLLQALVTLEDASVIHCDLKPENILLCPANMEDEAPQTWQLGAREGEGKQLEKLSQTMDSMAVNAAQASRASGRKNSTASGATASAGSPEIRRQPSPLPQPSRIKVIDFGSACFEGHTMYTYIQSRFYRAPEVLLGMPYNGAIDMWSLGCVCAEMFLGLPLFPGVSQHNQLLRIVEMLGSIPDGIIENSKHRQKFFKHNPQYRTGTDLPRYTLKTPEEYALETKTDVPTYKKYFRYTTLEDIVIHCPLPNRNRMTAQQKQRELADRRTFLDFLYGLLRLDQLERWTPREAIQHPFITGAQLKGAFQPSPDPLRNQRRFTHMVQFRQAAAQAPPPSSRRRQEQHAFPRPRPVEDATARSYQQPATIPYPIQHAQGADAGGAYMSQSYNPQGVHYPDEYLLGQSYGGSYGQSMMGPMSLGAMSFGADSGAFIPDFAMALHRPDRPVFQQASPTSPYQAGFLPTYNRQQRQYAYAQPGSGERSRSMSLDHGAPVEYVPRSYQYPASMSYQPQSMPMHLAAGYAMAHSHQAPAPSIALGPAGYQYMAAPHVQVPMEMGPPQHQSYIPGQHMQQHYQQQQQRQPSVEEASWDPFFMEAAEEFDTETKVDEALDEAERGSSEDSKHKSKSHRRRRSNPQQNRRTPQKQRAAKEHPPGGQPPHPHAHAQPHGTHPHPRPHGTHPHPHTHGRHGSQGSASARTRAQSWSDP